MVRFVVKEPEGMRLARLIVMVGLFLSACGFSGVTRDEAARLAVQAAGPDSSVSSAQQGRLGDFVDARTLPEIPRDRGVWAVVVAGEFPGECVITATGETRCPRTAQTALVLLDDQTGELLLLEAPAP